LFRMYKNSKVARSSIKTDLTNWKRKTLLTVMHWPWLTRSIIFLS
jgi:hypothetical protein